MSSRSPAPVRMMDTKEPKRKARSIMASDSAWARIGVMPISRFVVKQISDTTSTPQPVTTRRPQDATITTPQPMTTRRSDNWSGASLRSYFSVPASIPGSICATDSQLVRNSSLTMNPVPTALLAARRSENETWRPPEWTWSPILGPASAKLRRRCRLCPEFLLTARA